MYFPTAKTGFVAAILLCASFGGQSFAQEIAPAHLKAARAAVAATHSTDSFDAILFNTASRLKSELTAKNPDKADEIATVVDDEALKLAAKRGDLETEVARLFATNFSEEELNTIRDFFSSTAGNKYLGLAPKLSKEMGKSARIWAAGITRELNKNAVKRLNDSAPKTSTEN